MIVTCQKCHARFNLDDGLVKETGSKVRCSKCKLIFHVYPEKKPEPESLFPDKALDAVPDAKADAELFSEQAAGDKSVTDAAASLGEELDLSEIEKMLETASGEKALDFGPAETADAVRVQSPMDAAPSADASDAGMQALDLSEIEKILDMEQDLNAADLAGELEPDELVFDLEETASDGGETKSDLGDFDLADIEKMFAQEDADEPSPALDKAAQEVDLSDLEGLMETTSGPADDLTSVPEELELKLDLADSKDAMTAAHEAATASAGAEDLDFSGLEEMMAGEAAEVSAQEELKLDESTGELSLSLGSDDAAAPVPPSDEPDALDFSELEKVMTSEPSEQASEAGEELSLELGMEEPEVNSMAIESAEPDEIALEIEDAATPEAAEAPPMETEELDLEFDEEQLDQAVVAEEALVEGRVEETPAVSEAAEPVAAADVPEAPEKPAVTEKRRKWLFVLILVLVLLGGAAAIGYFYLVNNDMKIPFLSGAQKIEPVEPGNLHITTMDVDSRFVDNSQTGRLFVIAGKVRNDYRDARSFIRVTGRLFTQGKQPANVETVFCGNIMTDLEISKETFEVIKNRLTNRTGDNDANINIKPGEERPFMLVFSNLPENLEEFTLEVAGSESAVPVQK